MLTPLRAMNVPRAAKASPARWPAGGCLAGALAICLFLPFAGCDQVKHAAEVAKAAATPSSRPPQTFLDEDLLGPGLGGGEQGQPLHLTVGQIADFYGATGSWRKIDDQTYVLDVSQTDELTHNPVSLSIEFKPGVLKGWTCADCTPDQQFARIPRLIVNGDEGSDQEVVTLLKTVLAAKVPLSPTAQAALQQRTAELEQQAQQAAQSDQQRQDAEAAEPQAAAQSAQAAAPAAADAEQMHEAQ